MDPQPADAEIEALDLIVRGYDAVYAAIPGSPTLERLWRDNAPGGDYPWEFGHISFLPLTDLAQLSGLLGLRPGGLLVDLACGAGGPGLWVVRETGARLIGVDPSEVGLTAATSRADHVGLGAAARFTPGTFAATGLPGGIADAAMSIDALQYAPDKDAALREAARIVRPGGRLAFTAFELEPYAVAGLPVWGLDPVDDYRPLLEASGFSLLAYEETPGWAERVEATYTAVVAALEDLTAEMGEAAASALVLEASLTLQYHPYRRRVLVAAARGEHSPRNVDPSRSNRRPSG